MKFTKNIFTRKYCQNCETVKNISSEAQEIFKFAKKNEFSSIAIKEIIELNKYNKILKVYEQNNSFFIITSKHNYDHKNFLTGINLYGYLIKQDFPNKLKTIQLVSKSVYDEPRIIYPEIKYFIISNINCEEGQCGKGYGSMLMEQFFEVIKPFKPNKITGWLSPVDEFDDNNKKRRNHFYEKFGFEITDRHICKKLH